MVPHAPCLLVRTLVGMLLLASLLAGCADDAPAAMPPAEPILYDGADVPPGTENAPLVWSTLWEGDVALAPATPARAGVAVPRDTLQVLVNLTTEAGAIYGLQIDLGDCHCKRDLLIVAQPGEVWGADCGGLPAGDAPLSIATQAGALTGRASVVGVTCDTRMGRCPAPLPTTTA